MSNLRRGAACGASPAGIPSWVVKLLPGPCSEEGGMCEGSNFGGDMGHARRAVFLNRVLFGGGHVFEGVMFEWGHV